MDDMFARLEVIDGRQILAELVNGDEGPKIRIRRDNDITVEIFAGPWPDNDSGWDAAEKKLRDVDLTVAAAEIDSKVAGFQLTRQETSE